MSEFFTDAIRAEWFKGAVGSAMWCRCGALMDWRSAATLLEPRAFPILCCGCFDRTRARADELAQQTEPTRLPQRYWKRLAAQFADASNVIDGRTLASDSREASDSARAIPAASAMRINHFSSFEVARRIISNAAAAVPVTGDALTTEKPKAGIDFANGEETEIDAVIVCWLCEESAEVRTTKPGFLDAIEGMLRDHAKCNHPTDWE